jgi:hypothetical protein
MPSRFATPLLAALLLGQSVTPAFKPEWSAVLPANPMPRGQFWCSRPGPGLTGYWRPDPEIIRELEAALAPALQLALERAIDNPARRPAIGEYYRQYVGIRAGGRRAVYINGFHRNHVETTTRVRPQLASSWLTQAVNVCDGGRNYFGAEYDPSTRKVRNIEFNGPGE